MNQHQVGEPPFPEPLESTTAAQAKLAADLSRALRGSRIRLKLHDGEIREGVKEKCDGSGISLARIGVTRFSDIESFEIVASEDDPQRLN